MITKQATSLIGRCRGGEEEREEREGGREGRGIAGRTEMRDQLETWPQPLHTMEAQNWFGRYLKRRSNI